MKIWNPRRWQQTWLRVPTFSFRQPAVVKPAKDSLLHCSDFDQTEEESTCVSAAWPPVGGKAVIPTYFNNGGDSLSSLSVSSTSRLAVNASGLEGPSRPVIWRSWFPLKRMYCAHRLSLNIQRVWVTMREGCLQLALSAPAQQQMDEARGANGNMTLHNHITLVCFSAILALNQEQCGLKLYFIFLRYLKLVTKQPKSRSRSY